MGLKKRGASANGDSSRSAANSYEESTMTVNERLLKRVHDIYTEKSDKGLIGIAEHVGHPVLAPRKKITVMLMGTHSSGKSSWTNWYVEESIQKTGMAIETQGFTLVTSGKKRETYTGNATVHLYPQLEPITRIPGVIEHLVTEISTSKQKKFPVVTFVDTPGLVDGAISYPYDISAAMLGIAKQVDLIFVFFDPHGAGTSVRTMDVVEQLHVEHGDKMRFYLSKADQVTDEADRQKVLIQITQNLSQRISHKNFNLHTIYTIESPNCRVVNQVNTMCKEVEKTINMAVQNTLNTLESDCKAIAARIDHKLDSDRAARTANLNARFKGLLLFMGALVIPVVLLSHFLYTLIVKDRDDDLYNEYFARFSAVMTRVQDQIPADYAAHVFGLLTLIVVVLLAMSKIAWKIKPTLSAREKKLLMDMRRYVSITLMKEKKEMYDEYFAQAISADQK